MVKGLSEIASCREKGNGPVKSGLRGQILLQPDVDNTTIHIHPVNHCLGSKISVARKSILLRVMCRPKHKTGAGIK